MFSAMMDPGSNVCKLGGAGSVSSLAWSHQDGPLPRAPTRVSQVVRAVALFATIICGLREACLQFASLRFSKLRPNS